MNLRARMAEMHRQKHENRMAKYNVEIVVEPEEEEEKPLIEERENKVKSKLFGKRKTE